MLCHECWPDMQGADCENLANNNTLYNCTNYGVYDLTVTCFSAFIVLPGNFLNNDLEQISILMSLN